MQAFIIPLLFIVGVTYLNMLIWKKNFAQVLPLTFMECIFILFVTGFFDLRIGYYICVLISILGLIMIPVGIYQAKKTGKEIVKWEFDYETVLFITLYVFLFALNFRKNFYKWDDFSHWGVMAKETLRLNQFYYVPESAVTAHKDYPPLSALLQYLWCKLGGAYKESFLFNVKHIFCFSLIIPLLQEWKNKCADKWYKTIGNILLTIMIFITALTCNSIGEALFFRSIYPECVLSLLFFYGMYILYRGENDKSIYDIFELVLMGTCLLMTKQIAFYFWGILILYYFLDALLIRKKISRKWMVSTCCIVLVTLFTWNTYRIIANKYESIRQFNEKKFALSNIMNVLSGNGEEYQIETFQNYVSNLLGYPLIKRPLTLSYIQIAFVCMVLLAFLYYLYKNEEQKHSFLVLGFIQLIAMAGYIGVMLLSYLFGFGVSDAVSVTCYNRYMLTLLYPILLFDVFLLIRALNQKGKLNFFKQQMIVLLFTAVILYPPELMEVELKPGVLCENQMESFEGDAELINQYTEEYAKIYFVSQEDNGSIWNMIAYQTTPRRYIHSGYSLGMPYSEDDEYTENLSVEEWKERLSKFDYLYLCNVDEQFTSTYGEVFPDLHIRNQQLYKIQNQNGTISLKLIIEKEWDS